MAFQVQVEHKQNASGTQAARKFGIQFRADIGGACCLVVWGTLVIGLWGVDGMDPGSAGIGLLNGGGISQLGIQAVGCAAYAIWTLITCWIAWSIIGGLFGGIRVTEKEEIEGLDIGEHGMEAYPDFASAK